MIEFKNACKSYDNQSLALDDVSFTISDGEFVYPLASLYSTQDLKLTRQEMMRYLNKTTLTDILG